MEIPLTPNPSPVEIERKIRGWSVMDLTEMADISSQTIYDVENGVLPHIPPAIVRAFGRNIQEMEREYNEWQTECRKTSPTLILHSMDELDAFLKINDKHPFETWYTRNGYTLVTFSELIKVSRRAIINYTNGSQSMPDVVKYALLEMRWQHRFFKLDGEVEIKDYSAEQAVDILTRLGDEYARRRSTDVIQRSLLANQGRTRIEGNGAEFIERRD